MSRRIIYYDWGQIMAKKYQGQKQILDEETKLNHNLVVTVYSVQNKSWANIYFIDIRKAIMQFRIIATETDVNPTA